MMRYLPPVQERASVHSLVPVVLVGPLWPPVAALVLPSQPALALLRQERPPASVQVQEPRREEQQVQVLSPELLRPFVVASDSAPGHILKATFLKQQPTQTPIESELS